MAKAMALVVLPILLLSSFTVFAEHLETPPPTSPQAAPPHYHHPHPHPHPLPHSPTSAPVPPPAYPPYPHHHHRHHRHHHYPPAPAPVHPPPPTPAPTKPPTPPHYPPTPTRTPTPAPPKPPTPPTHPHYPPTPIPAPPKPPTPPHYPPAPVKPPVHPPVPVVHPPAHPPVHPVPRSFVAVQGVVYVKSCKYAGVDTLLGAVPVLGAVVKLQCNNTRYKLVQTAKTDKNGYFFLEAPKTITTFGAHKCNVVLVSAPTGLKPSNLHGGVTGAVLRPEKPYFSDKQLPFFLYTVGPLAFEPKCLH